MSHWQRTDPDRYAEIPEPKETFFQQLGEQAEREIQQLEDAIAGSDPPNEDYLTKVGRLNAARQAAQERVLAELILHPLPGFDGAAGPGPAGQDDPPGRAGGDRASRPGARRGAVAPAAGPAGAGPSARSRHREPRGAAHPARRSRLSSGAAG